MRMWLQFGLASGAVVVLYAVFRRFKRRKPRTIDMGSVSESWLAEQRARRTDSM
jgi:membrane protein implicated in regulation of membrane protease activity